MITEVSAADFEQSLEELLNQVHCHKGSIVINKDDNPIAALVEAKLFARIRRTRENFDVLSDRITEAYADMLVEEGLAEIDAAVIAERQRC